MNRFPSPQAGAEKPLSMKTVSTNPVPTNPVAMKPISMKPEDSAPSLTLTYDSVLCDDYINTADVIIDQESPSPVGVFRYGGNPQALFVRADGALCHLAPNPGQTSAGWAVSEVSVGQTVREAAAGVDAHGTAHGFYTTDSALFHITFDGSNWSAPQQLPLCIGLNVARNFLTAEIVAYGADASGNLLLVQAPPSGTDWTATSLPLPGGNSLAGLSPVLVFTDAESDWVMAVPGSATSTGGQIDFYQGSTTAVQSGPDSVPTTAPISQVMLGYWTNNSALFLFTDTSNNLYTSVQGTTDVVTIPDTSVAYAAAVLDQAHHLHLYTTDPNANLSVLHQTGWAGASGPVWAPVIPLDTDFQTLYTDTSPADAAAFFATDLDGALWHYQQDPTTQLWLSGKAQMPGGAIAYRVPQYRTEISVVDANGNPVPNLPLAVTASTMSSILSQGLFQPVGTTQSATVTTNEMGRATICQLASDLNPPTLTLAAENLTTASLLAASNIHTYLTGTGTLNEGTSQPLPTFTAASLQGATVNGQPLAPTTQDPTNGLQIASTAVTGIQQIFQTQTNGTQGGAAAVKAKAGWAIDFTGPNGPVFHAFERSEDLEAYRNGFRTMHAADSSWWDSVKHFFQDVWQGIKNAAIDVANFVVDVAHDIVSVAVKIGDEIQQLGDLILSGIETAIAAVVSVFNWIETKIEDLIDWLKMMFDWGAISNTAQALQYVVTQAFPQVNNWLTQYAGIPVDNFFQKQEATVTAAFNTIIEQIDPGAQLSSLPPPASQTQLDVGLSDIVTLINKVENNWLVEKIESFFGGGPAFQTIANIDDLFTTLSNDFGPAFDSFQQAMNEFVNFFEEFSSDPSQLTTMETVSLLSAARDFSVGVLQFLDGIVQAFIALVQAAISYVGNILTADIDIPFFSGLWDQIASITGIPLPELSIAGLFCTALAIPVTLSYKVKYGSDTQPFPNGLSSVSARFDRTPQAAFGETDPALQEACQYAGVVIAALWAVFDTALDCVPDVSSKYLSIIDIVAPTLVCLFTWPGDSNVNDNCVPFTSIPTDNSEDQSALATWLSGWLPILLDIGLLLAPSTGKIARYIDPVGKGVMTGLGALGLISGIVTSSLGASGGEIAANVLGPLPATAAFLRLQSVEEASEGVTLAIKLVLDFFAGEGNAVALAV